MKRSNFFIWVGMAVAAGTAVGMFTKRKDLAKDGLLGAAIGVVAGLVAVGVYEYATRNEIPYYSSLSPLYDEADVA